MARAAKLTKAEFKSACAVFPEVTLRQLEALLDEGIKPLAISTLRARAEELEFKELLEVSLQRTTENRFHNWMMLLHCYSRLKELYDTTRQEKQWFELCMKLRSKISTTGIAYTIGDFAALVGESEATVRKALEAFGESLGLSIKEEKGD